MLERMRLADVTASRAQPNPMRAVDCLGEEMNRARAILGLAAELVAPDGTIDLLPMSDAAEMDSALNTAAALLVERLRAAPRHDDVPRLIGLSQQLGNAQVRLREAQLNERSEAIAGVQRALEALRTASSLSDFIRLAPTHVSKIGFQRCLVSRVDRDRWIARSCFVSDDPNLADAIVGVGKDGRTLDHRLVESEMVRRRSPLLVRRAQTNDRVDPGFKRVTSTTSYVAAPILVGSQVLGFVHADTPIEGREVDDFDRTLISTFAECVGYAVERFHYQERLRTIRDQVDAATGRAPDLLDELIASNEEPPPAPMGTVQHRPQAPHRRGGGVDLLTRREIEVLSHMADGRSNAQIAGDLFISEATVKAHVKHILRKLGASNRAEAVSRYLRAG